MVLRQKREENNILFIDASKEFIKSGNKNVLQASHIKKIVDTYKNKANIEKYSKLVLIEEVRENGYNLNIPRYIDSSEDTENYDIYATMFGGIPYEEIDTLKKYWDMLPDLKNKLFKETSTPYTTLNNTDIKNIILNHKSINNFIDSFNNSFADFGEYLKNILIAKSQTLHIANTEDEISKNIYNRIKDLKLLNYYDAYQYFIDEWQIIENDLEIMQTEGFNAVKQVNPNIVKKKKNNKEVEVQEGWIGHILPFNIVQETFLQDKYNKLTAKQARIEEIQEELTEIIESLPEEERESTIINDDNTAFVSHLRMEGKYHYVDQYIPLNKHDHIIFNLDDGKQLRYNDTRKFGRMKLVSLDNYSNELPLSKLGAEPFNVDVKELYAKLHKCKLPIKHAILDQSIIAGIGNIYANEICFAMHLDPYTPAYKLTKKSVAELKEVSSKILEEAIEQGGTTIHSFSANGIDGLFQVKLKAHMQKVCPICGGEITKEAIKGRGTYYCKQCQKRRK